MLDFLKVFAKTLFILALVSVLLTGPIYGLSLVLLFSLGRFPDPVLWLIAVYSGVYLFGLVIASARALLRPALVYGEELGSKIWIWLM